MSRPAYLDQPHVTSPSESWMRDRFKQRVRIGPTPMPDGELRPVWMHAAMVGKISALDFGLAAGMTVDTVDSNGATPLHVAASHNQLPAARHLLGLGADAAHANLWGDTALHRAASQGFAAMCQLLLEHGAKLQQRDWSGARAADLAEEEEHVEVLATFDAWIESHPQNFAGTSKVLPESIAPASLDELGRESVEVAADLRAADTGQRSRATRAMEGGIFGAASWM